MEDKQTKNNSLTDEAMKLKIIECFELGITLKSETIRWIRKNGFAISNERMIKLHAEAHSDWCASKKSAQDEGIQANVLDTLKSGLKAKIDHQKELEDEIANLQKMLDQGFINKSIKLPNVTKKLIKKEVFGVREIAILNQLIDSKRNELFRLDGMYAPVKKTLSGDKDNPLFPPPAVVQVYDYSRLTLEELIILKNLTEKCLIKPQQEAS